MHRKLSVRHLYEIVSALLSSKQLRLAGEDIESVRADSNSSKARMCMRMICNTHHHRSIDREVSNRWEEVITIVY